MRLGRVQVHGFRRLVDTGCAIRGKVVAFVGPNEAGKSSLLDALLTLENSDKIKTADRPRGVNPAESDKVIEAWFRLDDDDFAALAEITPSRPPTWYVIWKSYEGELFHRVEPRVDRDLSPRIAAARALARYASTRAGIQLLRSSDGVREEVGDALDALLEIAKSSDELDDEDHALGRRLVAGITPTDTRAAALVREAVDNWLVAEAGQPHPETAALELLWGRRPHFVRLSDRDRALASNYDLAAVVNNPPEALRNLCDVAQLDLRGLASQVIEGDVGAYVSSTEYANIRLREVFSAAWRQAPVAVRLHIDGGVLRIMVSNSGGGYSSIAERSDGLKAFVALTSFVARERVSGRPLILLIDEAEQHLHYDAQADLVRMLERQVLARQVIYTTHSPGCLPSDLGTGVRPVFPERTQDRSKLAAAFWTSSPGFQPLLLALGAGAAAYVPSRYAVLAEGPSDMLLLPSMIREVTGRDRLDYQVAPGIAETASARLSSLELEAPRVAYLVDGDAGGDAHRKRLLGAGVTVDRIVQLGGAGSGVTIEDLLREDVYIDAVNAVLDEIVDVRATALTATDLPTVGRAAAVDRWCDANGLPRLAKPVVASAVVEAAEKIVSPDGRGQLEAAHVALAAALKLPP